MDIAVIGAEGSARVAGLQRSLQSAGCTVQCLAPRLSVRPGQPLDGIVVVDEPQLHLPETWQQLREQVAFLGLPLLLLASLERAGLVEKQLAADDGRLLPLETPDEQVLTELRTRRELGPVDEPTRVQLAEVVGVAVAQALSEMAQLEVQVRKVYRKPLRQPLGDIVATMRLDSARLAALSLGIHEPTALALTRRVLGDLAQVTDRAMIEDCMAEVLNVVAGQAKALLAESPYRFRFTTPSVQRAASARQPAAPSEHCLVIVLTSELGLFALQILEGASEAKAGAEK